MKTPYLLLTNASACLRYLVLRDIFQLPSDDAELRELRFLREEDPIVNEIIHSFNLRSKSASAYLLSFKLAQMGYLGFDVSHPVVKELAEALFENQAADGSWNEMQSEDEAEEKEELPKIVRIRPLRTAYLLRGLAMCGYAEDPRAEKAYEWLLTYQLPDGGWAGGITDGVYAGPAGYRRLPQSRWGCRTTTTMILLCFAGHPNRRRAPAVQKSLDLLLGRETREVHNLGIEVARMAGVEKPKGFATYFARFDLVLLLDLCAKIGAGVNDERVKSLVEFFEGLQGPYGLWENPAYPQACHWITFDILRALMQLKGNDDWVSLTPQAPFDAQQRARKRF
ncbi:MAG TPA: hypothetical protein VHY08_03265 [Bacillota bacterium]|nr:hypothetical protein [Bacillota bacterium]